MVEWMRRYVQLTVFFQIDMGVSENRGPSYSTLNNRILIIRRPK